MHINHSKNRCKRLLKSLTIKTILLDSKNTNFSVNTQLLQKVLCLKAILQKNIKLTNKEKICRKKIRQILKIHLLEEKLLKNLQPEITPKSKNIEEKLPIVLAENNPEIRLKKNEVLKKEENILTQNNSEEDILKQN